MPKINMKYTNANQNAIGGKPSSSQGESRDLTEGTPPTHSLYCCHEGSVPRQVLVVWAGHDCREEHAQGLVVTALRELLHAGKVEDGVAILVHGLQTGAVVEQKHHYTEL